MLDLLEIGPVAKLVSGADELGHDGVDLIARMLAPSDSCAEDPAVEPGGGVSLDISGVVVIRGVLAECRVCRSRRVAVLAVELSTEDWCW